MERDGKKRGYRGLLAVATLAFFAGAKVESGLHGEASPSPSPPVELDTATLARCVDTLMRPTEKGDPIEDGVRLVQSRVALGEPDARALVLDTLVTVCMYTGEDGSGLWSYFQSALLNAARSAGRRLGRDRSCPILVADIADPAPNREEQYLWDDTITERGRRRQAAKQALCRLSEIDRALVTQRVVAGSSFAAIGAHLGLTENAAKKAFDRALVRLREAFEKISND